MATITIENVPDSVVKTLNYIHSDDYKNDLGESFDNAEDFLADLKKYKN